MLQWNKYFARSEWYIDNFCNGQNQPQIEEKPKNDFEDASSFTKVVPFQTTQRGRFLKPKQQTVFSKPERNKVEEASLQNFHDALLTRKMACFRSNHQKKTIHPCDTSKSQIVGCKLSSSRCLASHVVLNFIWIPSADLFMYLLYKALTHQSP